jgi:hypothetical protein
VVVELNITRKNIPKGAGRSKIKFSISLLFFIHNKNAQQNVPGLDNEGRECADFTD